MARRRTPLGVLFVTLTLGFAALAVWAGTARQWVVLVAAGALAVWMGDLAVRSLR